MKHLAARDYENILQVRTRTPMDTEVREVLIPRCSVLFRVSRDLSPM